MSHKRADRPTAARDDNDEKRQSNKSARLDSGDAGASSAAESAAAAASSAVSSAALVLLSPAQRLYPDALISVFGFLDLRDVISAHASCRSWRDAAHKEPSRKINLHCWPSQLDWFLASPLRHHVIEYSATEYSKCPLEQFASLRAFPALTRVPIAVDRQSLEPLAALQGQAGYAEAIAAAVAQWPPRLTCLHIEFSDDSHQAEAIMARQVLIDCIGRLGSLTELKLRLGMSAGLALQPLLQLTQLQTLQLDGFSADVFACSVLKQMGSLTHLNFGSERVSLEVLQALCAPPHQLNSLQQIDFRGDATAARMEALLRLPALSTLNLSCMNAAAVPFLPRFTRLRTLTLYVAEAFMPHLTQCTQLTTLNLGIVRLTLADLTQLTRSLTALTSLQFQDVGLGGLDWTDSLMCLHSLPHLRDLKFLGCSGLRLAHLMDHAFTSLASLRSLEVFLCQENEPEHRALFKVPCTFMPQLLHCRWH